ncbi:MAG: hypothetical protein K2X87_31935 [Gemmataceae bacterium]|nr:hypothetical protein [Gemmataceae bacterium]
MASVNKEVLKKHHFWILTGLVPLLVLIAVILITSGVGGAIDRKRDEVDKTTKDLGSKKDPKSNPLLAKMDEQKGTLEGKRGDLWKDNWERQVGIDPETGKQDPARNLLRWPNSPKLAAFNYTADYLKDPNQLRFGEKIARAVADAKGEVKREDPNLTGVYNEFKRREVYLAEYSNANPRQMLAGTGMADTVAPTRFLRGWDQTLRYVTVPEAGTTTGWGEVDPKSDQLWLALEDIWVQRAVLEAVRQVNKDIGRFDRVPRPDANGKDLPDDPLHRRFKSRLWEVDLDVTQREADRRWVVTGRLRNLSDRLQLLGSQVSGKPSPLRLVLQLSPNAQPWDFEVEGTFVPGGAAYPVPPTDRHVLPPGVVPTEIMKVEQPFDGATVPVRRIDRLYLGYRDSRHAAVPLKGPADIEADKDRVIFPDYKKDAAAAAEGGATGGSGTGMEQMMGGMMGQMMKPGGPAGAGGAGGRSAAVREGGGTVGGVIDGNKNRYVELTPQVRRLPVAICLITDQAYIQDVLLAYANSPLRFQITQVHWQRFRGSLGGTGGTSAGGFGGLFGGAMGGTPPAAGGGDDDAVGGGGGGKVGGSASGMMGSGFELGGGGLAGKMGMGPSAGGPSAGGPAGGGVSFGGLSVSEAQLSSGLVELTIYGIVSIYDKYVPPPDAAVAAKQ